MFKSNLNFYKSIVLSLTVSAATPLYAQAYIDGIVDTSTASPANTALNARVLAKPNAAIGATIPHGSAISLQGPCRRYNANYSKVMSAFDIASMSKVSAQSRMAQARTWCVVWVDSTNGTSNSLWVSAKYIKL
jgi:hypothetical protein